MKWTKERPVVNGFYWCKWTEYKKTTICPCEFRWIKPGYFEIHPTSGMYMNSPTYDAMNKVTPIEFSSEQIVVPEFDPET